MKTKVMHLTFSCLSYFSLLSFYFTSNNFLLPILFLCMKAVSVLYKHFSAFHHWRISSGNKVSHLKNINFIIFFLLHHLIVITLSSL